MSHLCENVEHGDLARLIHPELHIDEYKSKMGNDSDICVLSLKVSGKEPASDIVNFIEKGYDYVLDADVSSGEKEDGDYLVFIEIERSKELPIQIVDLMSDLMNLSDQKLSEWRVRYFQSSVDHELTVDALQKLIPLNDKQYDKKYPSDSNELDKLRSDAGIDIKTKAPDNKFTESIRVAAGIL